MSAPDGPQRRGAMSPALLEALSDRLESALLVVTPDRRLTFANRAARELLELEEPYEGRVLSDLVSDYRVELAIRGCIARGEDVVEALPDPVRGRRLVARAFPIGGGDGEPLEAVALLLRDDTRLHRLETVRRDFVANVSHELRTPISAIQLLVETLQRGALEEPEVAADFVGKIGLEVGHMAQMVAELLELSTIESGVLPLHRVPTPVERLTAAGTRLRPLADDKHIELRVDVDPATPAVNGDEERLVQAVRNLVHNAIKFTPEGGTVTITARPGVAPDTVELSVADTGCGIEPRDLSRIFERFFKSDRSRRRDGDSSGLGLSIVRHTVEAHGGTVQIASEPGQGSVFTLVLPAVKVGATTAD